MFGASAASPWSRFLNRAVSSSSFSVHQTPETLATVAAGCSVLVNTSCRLVNLTAHLRQKAGLPPDASLHVLPATIALLAEDGNLVSLEQDLKEGAAQTQTMGNSLLKERAIYVLVRTISKRERTWSPSAMSPYWRTWMTITQSWQRNCAGCRASPLRATTGGSAWAPGVAVMSKAPLQGPERALIKVMDCTL
ncbi:uncharacterized protein C22orf15 homolog isoform X10 [Trachypithecus francoisi]|uniref:uncharacterized protein C22orf15 homolog isoform X10 n=1 Tax=Trachypithecus francoisi TaxID=54180 RepID=UPI00141AC0E0|nr:uncharacterized protein C22orf15 homolog isoform X10 [Trachypithecus francoisi]